MHFYRTNFQKFSSNLAHSYIRFCKLIIELVTQVNQSHILKGIFFKFICQRMFGNGLRLTRMTLKATTLGNGIGYPVPTAPVVKTCIVTLIITKIQNKFLRGLTILVYLVIFNACYLHSSLQSLSSMVQASLNKCPLFLCLSC